MPIHDFFTQQARTRTAEAIRHVESTTNAELVVAVRRQSGRYLHAYFAVGLVTLMITLCVILFVDIEFALHAIPFEVLAGFAFGLLLAAVVAPLRRLATLRSEREARVGVAARACFHDAGISKTRGRTGLLLYYSAFERRAELVADVGLDLTKLPVGWDSAIHAAAARADFEAMLEAIRGLGPPLGSLSPKTDDDVNELSNEVNAR
jgi:putative membrane protein